MRQDYIITILRMIPGGLQNLCSSHRYALPHGEHDHGALKSFIPPVHILKKVLLCRPGNSVSSSTLVHFHTHERPNWEL
jgi:hypothetical protein